MSEVAEQGPHEIDEGQFARSVALSIGAGLPVALVVITLAVWLMLDVSFGKAFAISAWPAILTGVFGGGFVGVVRGAK
jgi:VIT1/CCC1 family predicted Fe2+/Mn2+ transporter